MARKSFPTGSTPSDDVMAAIADLAKGDPDPDANRLALYAMYPGDEVHAMATRAWHAYSHPNALVGRLIPSLFRMEQEVVEMGLDLLQAPEGAAGVLISGGSDSLFQALYTARETGRIERAIDHPNIVVPRTAHASLEKSAHYLGIEVRRVHEREDRRADVEATKGLIDGNTVLLFGSAPHYPMGQFDPIPELAALAQERGLLMHVDACVGGFLAPFMRENGEPIPPFDFAVPGVTSMSADLHKYGYTAKGASLILYRDAALAERQRFTCDAWPYGAYSVKTFAGSRPAGPVASAWAVLHHLGRDGYREIARRTVAARCRMMAGIAAIPDLYCHPEKPDLSIFLICSDSLDMFQVADEVAKRGFIVFRAGEPRSIHMLGDPRPDDLVDRFLGVLAEAAAEVRAGRKKDMGGGAVYA
ncbi:MAG: aminotransferase class V-fold PLP-dependent enzyme [Proteobacteria bacterium]|nr:aminotransferase class V-fold PLP-dependent enzyme [Pseudomonadota bacterium]